MKLDSHRVVLTALAVWGLAAATLAAQDTLAPYEELGQSLEESLSECDPALLEASLDVDLLVHRAAQGLELSSTEREDFLKGFKSSFGFGAAVCQGIGDAGSYKLLRVREVDGKPRALFRMLSDGGGMNYHDMLLARLPGDQIRVVDVFIYLSGEWLSETVRRAILPLIAEKDRSILGRLVQGESAYVASLVRIQGMSEHVMAGRFREALAAYRELPPEVQRDKTVMLTRFTAAVRLNDDEVYKAALEDFKTTFPDDPSIELLLVDYYFFRQEYPTVFGIIDRIEKAVGGDPYLHHLRANVAYAMGRLDEARKHAYQAIREEPELQDAYWVVVTVALEQENHKETAAFLSGLIDRFGIELPDLTTVPEYAKFVKSDVYRDWMAQRRKGGGE